MQYRVLLPSLFVVIALLSACSERPVPYQLPENALQLIGSDTSKIWKVVKRLNNNTRMNMGNCFLSYRLTYSADGNFHDNNGDFPDCGKTMKGSWNLAVDQNGHSYIKLRSQQIPELFNIKEDFKLFKILYLAEDELVVQFRHKQFSDNPSTIIDTYVPEGLPVEGREFHW